MNVNNSLNLLTFPLDIILKIIGKTPINSALKCKEVCTMLYEIISTRQVEECQQLVLTIKKIPTLVNHSLVDLKVQLSGMQLLNKECFKDFVQSINEKIADQVFELHYTKDMTNRNKEIAILINNKNDFEYLQKYGFVDCLVDRFTEEFLKNPTTAINDKVTRVLDKRKL